MEFIKTLKIKGYKSIREAEIELRPLNVLIGANGSGKSNLISFFNFLQLMIGQKLQEFVGVTGGANGLLFYGGKTTQFVEAEIAVGEALYYFRLAHAADDTLVFTDERFCRSPVKQEDELPWTTLGAGHRESKLLEAATHAQVDVQKRGQTPAVDPLWELAVTETILEPYRLFRRIAAFGLTYQFNDTSIGSKMRLRNDINENKSLNFNGSNLAAMLYRLQQANPKHYARIVDVIRVIAPFFHDFSLARDKLSPSSITLRWRATDSQYEFGAYHLSDGTLRAMALVTLLFMPDEDLPPVIVIDEPELGLHPTAINIIAGLMKAASQKKQVIIATQSAAMVDQFDPEDVVVTELRAKEAHGARESTFKRLAKDDLADWLKDYTLGQLWDKNVFGGVP